MILWFLFLFTDEDKHAGRDIYIRPQPDSARNSESFSSDYVGPIMFLTMQAKNQLGSA